MYVARRGPYVTVPADHLGDTRRYLAHMTLQTARATQLAYIGPTGKNLCHTCWLATIISIKMTFRYHLYTSLSSDTPEDIHAVVTGVGGFSMPANQGICGWVCT